QCIFSPSHLSLVPPILELGDPRRRSAQLLHRRRGAPLLDPGRPHPLLLRAGAALSPGSNRIGLRTMCRRPIRARKGRRIRAAPRRGRRRGGAGLPAASSPPLPRCCCCSFAPVPGMDGEGELRRQLLDLCFHAPQSPPSSRLPTRHRLPLTRGCCPRSPRWPRACACSPAGPHSGLLCPSAQACWSRRRSRTVASFCCRACLCPSPITNARSVLSPNHAPPQAASSTSTPLLLQSVASWSYWDLW
ncbi:unnamed protein product, partial [Urochloa humidicola]